MLVSSVMLLLQLMHTPVPPTCNVWGGVGAHRKPLFRLGGPRAEGRVRVQNVGVTDSGPCPMPGTRPPPGPLRDLALLWPYARLISSLTLCFLICARVPGQRVSRVCRGCWGFLRKQRQICGAWPSTWGEAVATDWEQSTFPCGAAPLPQIAASLMSP